MRSTFDSPLLLAGLSPDEWTATHLAGHYRQHHVDYSDLTASKWSSGRDVLADDAAYLRQTHAALCADGSTTTNAAAKWVIGWSAGVLADAVGFTLAMSGAGLLLDGSRVRIRLHPDGWIDEVDPVGAAIVVAIGHPWASRPGVQVVQDEVEVARLVVLALVGVVEPLVESCRSLARVGRGSLWAEVADGFGLSIVMQPDIPVDPAAVRRLNLGLCVDNAPWRKRPHLRVAESGCRCDDLGRKGGCCLAYQCTDESSVDLSDLDERTSAFDLRFPAKPDEPRYCSTCSLRDIADCEARQVFWLHNERAARCSVASSSLASVTD